MSLGFVRGGNTVARNTQTPTAETNIIVATPRLRVPDKSDRWWRRGTHVFAPVVSITLLIVESSAYNADDTPGYIIPSLVAVFVVLAFNQWLRTLLSMNLYNQQNRARYAAILFYILAMTSYMASSMAIMRMNWIVQFLGSLIGAILSWIGFLVVFEGNFLLPSRQQWASLGHILLAAFMWEVRTFLINQRFVD